MSEFSDGGEGAATLHVDAGGGSRNRELTVPALP